jgi:hypothetical protein
MGALVAARLAGEEMVVRPEDMLRAEAALRDTCDISDEYRVSWEAIARRLSSSQNWKHWTCNWMDPRPPRVIPVTTNCAIVMRFSQASHFSPSAGQLCTLEIL